MKGVSLTMLLGVGLIACLSLMSALGAKEPSSRERSQTAEVRPAPVYKPPLRGAPASRVGGASRGIAEGTLTLRVLAPDHTGLTIDAQPSLYWYLSESAPVRMELTVIDDQAVRPLLEVHLDAPKGAGVQRLDLSDHGVSLEPDVEYQWFVALIPDPDQRSRDLIAGGMIQYIRPSEALLARLNRADSQELAPIYAEEGLWYDAIAALSELIEANPGDQRLRGQRAALLEQVDLPAVAAYDRQAVAQQ